MTEPHKMRVRIGEHEFEAEGPQELVNQQFASFLQAVAAISAQTPATNISQQTAPPPPASNGTPVDPEVDPALIGRAFMQSNDVVSLRMLPRGEAQQSDALLMLLLGYDVLRNDKMVLGTQLTRSARQSGLGVDRVDRALARYDAYLLKGGARKGSRYGLNNQGRTRAMELLRLMLS